MWTYADCSPSITVVPSSASGSSIALQSVSDFLPASLGKRVKKTRPKLKGKGKKDIK